MSAKLFSIYGKVQGVAFRFFTQKQAEKLGIKGYVRNRQDGSVEIIAVAEDDIMTQFQNWLYQGSPSSQVTQVIADDFSGNSQFSCFEIRR